MKSEATLLKTHPFVKNTTRNQNPAKAYPSREMVVPPANRMFVQRTLEVGQSGDFYERQADAMADMVMRESSDSRKISTPPAGNGISTIQRSGGSSAFTVSPGMESQLSSSHGGGNVLPPALRSQMEGSFGFDFSAVRLHTGTPAIQMSSAINARAFTHGNDIYFNRGQYQPENTSGQHLLAHELTHVVQQTGKVQREESNDTEIVTKYSASQSSVPTVSNSDYSTPIPDTYKEKKNKTGKTENFNGTIENSRFIFNVKILPDKFNIRHQSDDGKTLPESVLNGYIISEISSSGYTEYIPSKSFNLNLDQKVENNKVVDFSFRGKITINLQIQTTYNTVVTYIKKEPDLIPAYDTLPDIRTLPSEYGAGPTLGEHEGSHGTDFLNYLRDEQRVPKFEGETGMSVADFRLKANDFSKNISSYLNNMEAHSKTMTDDPKTVKKSNP